MRAAPKYFGFLVAGMAYIAVPVVAYAAQPLIPHRAVYDLALADASDRSDITGLSGRMVYEFNGSRCDGYTVTFRFVTQIDTSEASRLTDQQTTTYENGKGTEFTFATKSFVDRALDRELRGTAKLSGDHTVVKLKKPAEDDIELKPTQFPTQHMIDLIDRARTGETFYETSIFDGSDDADEVLTTTVVIGKREAGDKGDKELSVLGDMSPQSFWPVSIAYFKMDGEGGEELPVYRIDFKLYENGITRDLIMDYGDFSMKGELVDLSVLEIDRSCSE